MKKKSIQWVVLFLILLTAFVFRFQHIQSIPPGLYPDEAMNGNDALKAIEQGDYKVFYPDNNGREGLFINLQAQSLKIFGNEPWALRIVPAFIGLITVLGIFLLTKTLYNWQIASIASFYLAISFWHLNFSRIGFRAIMAPMLAVFVFYFLWKGVQKARVWPFVISGILLGLGFHTYIGFRVVPLVVITFLAFWWIKIKKDYSHEKYTHLRNELIRGFSTLLLFSILTALPIFYHFWLNPEDFFGRASDVTIFKEEFVLKALLKSTIKTLGMFNFMGDWNWRHNIAGRPQLFWPIGIMFLIGIFKTLRKLFKDKRDHGHYSALDIFLISWFFFTLLPSILSSEGLPHALRSIGAIPPTMIFAALGTWRAFERLGLSYRLRDIHIESLRYKIHESKVIAGLTLIIFLLSMAFAEYYAYFKLWGESKNTSNAFSQNYVDIGRKLNQLPIETKKYVVVNTGDVFTKVLDPFDKRGKTRDIPTSAQTVMFITKTYSGQKQKEKNLFYILPEEKKLIKDKKAIIIILQE